jgi:hypothetical protein
VQALLDIPGLVQQGLQWLVLSRQPGPYAERRTAEGLSEKEIMRCLKRYVARDVYPRLRRLAN